MILLLGGTAEARALAAALVAEGRPVVSSLAGRVSNPRLPVGEVRVGGFGGVDGLAAYLLDHAVTAVVDATHPFAATISANAAVACARTGVPLLRLARPGWADLPQAQRWHWVDDHEQAALTARRLGGPALLTTGRQTLPVFTRTLGAADVVARVVEPVAELPPGWRLVLDRGPYTLDAELGLLREHRIAVLVTKDSGGDHTRAKLDAADRLGVSVVVVRRPPPPPGVPTVTDVEAALAWPAAR